MYNKIIGGITVWDKIKTLATEQYNGRYVVEFHKSKFETIQKKVWNAQLRREIIQLNVFRPAGLRIAI